MQATAFQILRLKTRFRTKKIIPEDKKSRQRENYLQATAVQIDESQTLLPRCRKEKGNNTLFSLSKGTKKMHQLFKK